MKYGELTLGQIEAVVNKLGGMEGVQCFLRGEITLAEKIKSALLQLFTSVTVPGVAHFSAADHFKHGEVVEGVKCYLWDNFQKHFGTKVEGGVGECEIHIHTLLTAARDLPIRAEIGEEREETKLAHLWYLLTLQPKGKEGALKTNGYANVFYLRDTENTLWAVDADWHGSEWSLGASSVEDPGRWRAGDRVCSR